MGIFDNGIMYLDAMGITDVILPFVLVFTVLFAVLMKVGIFTEPGSDGKTPTASRRYNSVIALAIALITVIPHITRTYPMDSDPVIIINAFLPGAVVLTIVLLVFLMLVGFLGGEKEATKSPLVGIAGIIAVVGLIIVLWKALYPTGWPSWLSFLDDTNLQAAIVIILIMGIIIYYVTGEKKEKSSTYKSLKELFGGS
jgi:hypothetical protein